MAKHTIKEYIEYTFLGLLGTVGVIVFIIDAVDEPEAPSTEPAVSETIIDRSKFLNKDPQAFQMIVSFSEGTKKAAEKFLKGNATFQDTFHYSNKNIFGAKTPDGKYHYPIEINNPGDEHKILYDIDCDGDGKYEASGLTNDIVCQYQTPGPHLISIRGDIPGIFIGENPHKDQPVGKGAYVLSIEQWGNIQWKAMDYMAAGCFQMQLNASDIPNLDGVKNMERMFWYAQKFNQPIGGWNTNNVTNMNGMFKDALSFNQPIGEWDTKNVTDMSSMFLWARSFNQPIGEWNTQNVTNMRHMFHGALSFNQPIGEWNTQNVTDMSDMFYDAKSFNQPIGQWNTQNVTDMSDMFYDADSFNQSIDQWNTQNVKKMDSMFSGVKGELWTIKLKNSRINVSSNYGWKNVHIGFNIENKSSYAIKTIFLNGKLYSPGRTMPWHEGITCVEFKGGLEPGETQSKWLEASLSNTWSEVEAFPNDAKFELEIIGVIRANEVPIGDTRIRQELCSSQWH